LEQCLFSIPEPQPRRQPVLLRRLPEGTVLLVDVDGPVDAIKLIDPEVVLAPIARFFVVAAD
jgi:hypothetical protein